MNAVTSSQTQNVFPKCSWPHTVIYATELRLFWMQCCLRAWRSWPSNIVYWIIVIAYKDFSGLSKPYNYMFCQWSPHSLKLYVVEHPSNINQSTPHRVMTFTLETHALCHLCIYWKWCFCGWMNTYPQETISKTYQCIAKCEQTLFHHMIVISWPFLDDFLTLIIVFQAWLKVL